MCHTVDNAFIVRIICSGKVFAFFSILIMIYIEWKKKLKLLSDFVRQMTIA